jgi:hypothetical protein
MCCDSSLSVPSHSTCIDASQHSSRCAERIRRNGRSCCDGMKSWGRLVCGRSELRQITGQLQEHAGDSHGAAQESAHCDRCTPIHTHSICCLNLPSFLHLTSCRRVPGAASCWCCYCLYRTLISDAMSDDAASAVFLQCSGVSVLGQQRDE